MIPLKFSGSSTTSARGVRMFYRIAETAESNNPFFVVGSGAWILHVAEYSGIDTLNPLNIEDAQANTASATMSTPTVSPSGSGDILIVGFGGNVTSSGTNSNEQVNSSTTGVTEREDAGRASLTSALYDKFVTGLSGTYAGSTDVSSSNVGSGAIAVFNQKASNPVQSVQTIELVNTSSNTTLAASFFNGQTAGNTMIVAVMDSSGTQNNVSSIVDTAGNTYTRIFSTNDATNSSNIELWYAYNIIAGSPLDNLTVTYGSTIRAAMIAQEWQGLKITDPLDVFTSALSTANPQTSGATSTTTQATEIVIGVVGSNTATFSQPNVGSGFSSLWEAGSRTARPFLAIERLGVTATGAQTATFVEASPTHACTVGVATFKIVVANTSPVGKSFISGQAMKRASYW